MTSDKCTTSYEVPDSDWCLDSGFFPDGSLATWVLCPYHVEGRMLLLTSKGTVPAHRPGSPAIEDEFVINRFLPSQVSRWCRTRLAVALADDD